MRDLYTTIKMPRMSRGLALAVAAMLLGVAALLLTLLPAGSSRPADAAASLHAIGAKSPAQNTPVAKGEAKAGQPQDCGLVWRVTPSQNGSATMNFIQKIYAVSANDVWAVGNYYETVGATQKLRAMAQHWDGATWSLVDVPLPGDQSYMNGISGTASNDIWAVGWYTAVGTTTALTFTIHWDGIQWSQVTSTNIGTGDNTLINVSAAAPDAVWAVGQTGNQGLVLFWDGTTWASITSPNPDPRVFLDGVTALTADDVWVVGFYGGNSGSLERTLTMHCSRSGCNTVTSPNSGVGDDGLEAVAALSTSDIYTVGYSTVTTDTHERAPLTLHWNGVGWSTLATPPLPPNADDFAFHDLSSVSSGGFWAVGYLYNSTNMHGQTYAAHFDGTTWTNFTPPNEGSSNVFYGSAVVGPDDVWAGGYTSSASGISQTLIEHYSDPCVTPTPSPVPTATPPGSCTIQFTDVPSDNTFYPYVICLACRGIISGYPCGGASEPCDANNNPYFRPSNPVSRGQLAKIVSNSAGFSDTPAGQTFEDVPVGSAFYDFVGRLASRDVMGGYACGSAGEPCGSGNLPYFRPGAGATRGQLTKIVSNAAGFNDAAPPTYTFTDVPVGSTFHLYVERLLLNRPGVMGGYACGGSGEPCDSENRSYFRPASPLTRGQTSKIVGNTFFPDCQAP